MSDTLQEFLVKLKYESSGREGFLSGIKSSESRVMRLGKALITGGTALGVFFGKYAARMEQVGFVARRTGSEVKELFALEQAGASLGTSVDGAKEALESLSKFMATTPGATSWLHGIGVQTRDAKGHALSTVKVMENLGKTFRSMPVWQANAFAGVVGIDYKTMLAMRDKHFSSYIEKFKKPLTGAHLDETAKVSNKAMIAGRVVTMKKEALESKASLPFLKAFVAADAKTQGLSTDMLGLAKALGEVSVAAIAFKAVTRSLFGASVAEGVAGKAGGAAEGVAGKAGKLGLLLRILPWLGRPTGYGAAGYGMYEGLKLTDKIPAVHALSDDLSKVIQGELKDFAKTPILGSALRKLDLLPPTIDIVRAKTAPPPAPASPVVTHHTAQTVHVNVHVNGAKDPHETARKVKEEIRMSTHNSGMVTH